MNQSSEQMAVQHETENSRREGYEHFHDGELGRCPQCGRLIMLPCLACQLDEPDEEFAEVTSEPFDESGLAIKLDEFETIRYRLLHAYREMFEISMFEDELRKKRLPVILRLLNLETRAIDSMNIANSNKSESFHSWSSDSRWFVFSSKRTDANFVQLYIAKTDDSGHVSKPFVLPQKAGVFYKA